MADSAWIPIGTEGKEGYARGLPGTRFVRLEVYRRGRQWWWYARSYDPLGFRSGQCASAATAKRCAMRVARQWQRGGGDG